MAKRGKKAARLTVGIADDDHPALHAIAARSDVSLSWIIRQAIHRFIREHSAHPELSLTPAAQSDKREGSKR